VDLGISPQTHATMLPYVLAFNAVQARPVRRPTLLGKKYIFDHESYDFLHLV
jgi:hypothetical protein